jgi:hypothetical protein
LLDLRQGKKEFEASHELISRLIRVRLGPGPYRTSPSSLGFDASDPREVRLHRETKYCSTMALNEILHANSCPGPDVV